MSTEHSAPEGAQGNLATELRGWRETDGISDDARRKLWLMRKAADRIEAQAKEIAELKAAQQQVVQTARYFLQRGVDDLGRGEIDRLIREVLATG